MTPAEQNFERDAGVASATMKGSRVEGDRVVLTVNKPTVGDYPTRTDIVTTDATGKRTVQPGKVVVAKPILGQRDGQINHLHGVEKEDEDD